jgi:hypothetical protein
MKYTLHGHTVEITASNPQSTEVIRRLLNTLPADLVLDVGLQVLREFQKTERTVPFYDCKHGIPGGCQWCTAMGDEAHIDDSPEGIYGDALRNNPHA